MFTSEYYLMLNDAQEGGLTSEDVEIYRLKITKCMNLQGMLLRGPRIVPTEQTQCDDYYAVLNACRQFNITDIPKAFIKAVWKYKGALNTINPGIWTWNSCLIRQIQLLAAIITASYPKNWFIKALITPLYAYSALIIATSCIGVDYTQTDQRRLAWHLLRTLAPESWLCRFASVIWYHRLRKDYGDAGMRAVAAIYYDPKGYNPFSLYWPK